MPRDLNPTILDMLQDPDSFIGRRNWPGIWPGRVEDIQDPKLLGRIRVRIPQVHPKDDEDNTIPVNHLPWALPCFADAGDDYGDFHVPYRLGDWIWVMFVGGNQDYPVWMGSWYGEGDNANGKTQVPKECSESNNYPHRRIIKSRRGHKLEIIDDDGDMAIKFTDAKGNFIKMGTDSNLLQIFWQGDREDVIEGNYDIRVGGDMTVLVGGESKQQVEGDVHLNLKRGVEERIGGDYNHQVDGEDTDDSGNPDELEALGDPKEDKKPAFPDKLEDFFEERVIGFNEQTPVVKKIAKDSDKITPRAPDSKAGFVKIGD